VKLKMSSLLAACLLLVTIAQAGDGFVDGTGLSEAQCPDANVFSNKMLSNVCWDCLFPIQIAGAPIYSSGNVAPVRAARGFCYCPGCGYIGRFGVTVGYWSPSRLIELVQKPYCMPSLGGQVMSDLSPFVSRLSYGKHDGWDHGAGREPEGGFAHFHYYTYPILAILGMMDAYDCIDDGMSDFDLLMMSEVLPNWTDDTLSTYLNPEVGLLSNPRAALAQPLDCIASTGFYPNDALFWVAGCWGSHFPLGGHIRGHSSAINASSLRVSRALFMLHRIGMATRQGGQDAVCKGVREPIMTKSFYRAQQFWPMPETGSSSGDMGGFQGDGSSGSPFNLGSLLPVCCHALGANVLTWGDWRKVPIYGEDYIHLAWRWVDCCVGVCI
jgi:conjugal transfer pilus assembly protein TraU